MATVSVPVTIEIVRGAAADRLLADETFRAQWSALCDQCPWSTPFQAPGFARTWYSVYRNQWEPLLALSRDGSGQLTGFLPLAISADARQLVVAGAHQAEYQTWVALPDVGNDFIRQAIESLHREAPKAVLSFHYLPPASPLAWLKEPPARRTCLLQTHKRPLMMLRGADDVHASLAKRGNKSRLKRLGKVGKVEFKQLHDAGELEALIDDVMLFYDSRRMAVNGNAPFTTDPLKRRFHIEMMTVPDLLHATALMCGDRVASFHFNTIDRKHVQLSLIAHNPLLADHSPGKFHILMLGKLLLEQGYEWIDLTPGGDPYKERFANAWDEVYTLTVFRNSLERHKAAIVNTFQDRTKNTLTRWDIRPAHAKALAHKFMRPSGLLHLTREWLSSSQEALVYSRDARTNGFHATNESLIRRDAIDDLMAYAPSAGGPTLHEFVSDAMRRIEDGQRVYTCAENGRLLHHAWFAATPSKEWITTALPGCEIAENCGLIVDSYTIPSARRRGLASASIAAILQDACGIKNLNRTLIVVPAKSAVARRLVERAGFTYERSCVRQFPQM